MANTIYQVVNLVNGHAYIGITRFSPAYRWKQHTYVARCGSKTTLAYAIRKYGAENFEVSAVASCLTNDRATERDVIQSFAPEYNMTDGGETTNGRLPPRSAESKIRSSLAQKGKKRSAEVKKNISDGKKKMMLDCPEVKDAMTKRILEAGKKVDREKQRAAIRKAASEGKMSWVMSPERKLVQMARLQSATSREKMARSKDKPVECIELATVFDSVSEAAFYTGLSISGVSCVCRKTRNSANGLHFNFI